MVLGIVICGVVILGVGYSIGLRVLFRRPTAQEQLARTHQAAVLQVDDVFHEARIRMEEAAGVRRPGEQRISDGIRGSWRSW